MFANTFKSKIVIPTSIIFCLLVAVLIGFSAWKFTTFSGDLINDKLNSTVGGFKTHLNDTKNNTKAAAFLISMDPSVVNAIRARDTNEIIRLLTLTLDSYNVDYYTVCDNNGTVLARTHEPSNFGDSVLSQQNIKDALNGKISTYCEAGSAVKVSIRTGVPVYDFDGSLLGVISAGVRFDSDSTVDELKKLYGAEVTVFSGDTRVATTIMKDGERIVGTQLNPDIAKIVLEDKQEYHGTADILGSKYHTVYIPLIGPDNEAFAIIFFGDSYENLTSESFSFIRDAIIIGLAGLAVSILLLFLIASTISKPIITLSKDMEKIAKGNLNINTHTNSKDEIGLLNKSLQKIVNTIRNLLDDINIMVSEQEKGDIDFTIDTDKFNGDYKIIADNMLNLVSTANNDNMSLLNILSEFGDGNFEADLPKYPGKKIIINQKVDIMRENLQNLSKEIVQLTSQAINGNLSARADSSQFNGDWQTIVGGLNKLLNAITEPIRESILALREMSKGNLSTRIRGDYKGDFAIIKESLNATSITISSYIDEISQALDGLAKNNLNQEITGEYVGDFANIKDSLNNIFSELSRIIEGIRSASEQVTLGAKQMADSGEDLALGATQQASSIEELSATLTTVNEKTRNNADSAQKAEALSNKSSESALLGNNEMKKMLTAMNEIRISSSSISNIINVIDDIANQTNLLALNAAVEAARAGEHGKGFSIVASEVRSLAQRSLIAAKDTTKLIESSVQKVNEGSEIAKSMENSLEEIVSNITEASDIISKISGTLDEQATSIAQINDGINQIAQVVQNNTAIAEESASASEELSNQSEVLNKMIRVFDLRKHNAKYTDQIA